MKPIVIKNVLSESEIADIQSSIANAEEIETQSKYGRYMYHGVQWSEDRTFYDTVSHKVSEALNRNDFKIKGAGCVTYTAEAGKPDLPPHFDADNTELIMTYQIESNTTWSIGVDLETFDISDNDGLLFHPNENIHWRTHKKFEDGEFVTLLFFRFDVPNQKSYEHKQYSQLDPVFSEVHAYRDSL